MDLQLAGKVAATLVLNPVRLSDAGAYQVVVSNGSGSVTSSVALLIVHGANDPFYSPPDGGWAYRYSGDGVAAADVAAGGSWRARECAEGADRQCCEGDCSLDAHWNASKFRRAPSRRYKIGWHVDQMISKISAVRNNRGKPYERTVKAT